MDEFKIIESPLTQIIADIVKNNKNLTPRLQNAIAQFLEYEINPRIKLHPSQEDKVDE